MSKHTWLVLGVSLAMSACASSNTPEPAVAAPAATDATAATTGAARSSVRLGFHVAMAVVCAGLIWGLYNIGFLMIFSFGPSMLVERGWSITLAGSTISIVLWLFAASVPLGGLLADRTGRHEAIMVSCFLLTAVLMLAATRIDAVIPIFVALGALSGLAAGPIMSLPARVLQPRGRSAWACSFPFHTLDWF